MADPVVIVDYDPSWPSTFQQLRDQLAAMLESLAAKPIIDLDVVIADRTGLPAVIERLRPLGYQHEGDLGTSALDRHLALRDARHCMACKRSPGRPAALLP